MSSLIFIFIYSREEQEKFNIWIAYLNLENLYGTQEKLKEILARALQQNQAIKVYQQLVNIYVKSGKIQVWNFCSFIHLKNFFFLKPNYLKLNDISFRYVEKVTVFKQ